MLCPRHCYRTNIPQLRQATKNRLCVGKSTHRDTFPSLFVYRSVVYVSYHLLLSGSPSFNDFFLAHAQHFTHTSTCRHIFSIYRRQQTPARLFSKSDLYRLSESSNASRTCFSAVTSWPMLRIPTNLPQPSLMFLLFHRVQT